MQYKSIVQPFYKRAKEDPDGLAIVFITDDKPDIKITYGELMAGAQRVAQHLRHSGINDQEVVFIALPFSVELLETIWGVLLLGAIPAVYTYYHPGQDTNLYINQMHSLLQKSKVDMIVTLPEIKKGMQERNIDLGCPVITEIDKDGNPIQEFELADGYELSAENIAVLQFSSGSTGQRKGVMISHRAIFGYDRGLDQVIKINSNDVNVSWLPLYHDLGLINGIFLPIIHGYPSVIISPVHWIYRPEIIFQAVSKYRGTFTWMPNFAFKHSLRVTEENLKGVDLSSWRTVGSGGEPVEGDSLELFYEKFSRYGLERTALACGYGLAEQVVGIARTPIIGPPNVDWVDRTKLQEQGIAETVDKNSSNRKSFVSCGAPYQGVEIRFVNDLGEDLPERQVGEIALRGDQMFSGYYQQPELTAQVVRDGWFYTGDLGYMFGGEIYICGRIKDMIIVGGDNIYPQDIEAILGEFTALRPGRAAAFGLFDEKLGTEKVIVAAELKQPHNNQERSKLAALIRQRVFEGLNIRVAKVHLVEEKGWVVKTSSGKMARSASKEKYIEEFKSN